MKTGNTKFVPESWGSKKEHSDTTVTGEKIPCLNTVEKPGEGRFLGNHAVVAESDG